MENVRFGAFIDCSRNAVKTVDTVKNFAAAIKKAGYNALYLYLEDVYEIETEPYFGHLRGRYSVAELKELDDYCCSIGIELIPAIQTLAHLGRLFTWEEYENIHDIDYVMLVGVEKTYELIDKMFAAMKKCFRSRSINIGMDEARYLGLGEYVKKFGYKKPDEILAEHLSRVVETAKKYGFKPSMWSDMFIRTVHDGEYYPEKPNYKAVAAQKANIPENVTPVYWDYYHDRKRDYERFIKMHELLSDSIIFAGGVRTSFSFVPHNLNSAKKMRAAMDVCREHGVKDIVITTWGDDGGECSPFSVLPTLLFLIERYKNGSTRKNSDEKFYKLFGIKAKAFYDLDLLDIYNGLSHASFSKLFLFNDPFIGFFDYHIKDGANKYYKSLALKYRRLIKTTAEYSYIFENAYRLADFLSVKAELGNITRKAYLSGDTASLKKICDETYPAAIKKLRALYASVKRVWSRENKPFGAEVQALRFGGLITRLEDCRKTLKNYIDGNIDAIKELEEPTLPYADITKPILATHLRIVSPGVIDGNL